MSHGLVGPSSTAWRIDRERALLLTGGRALLMQLAHPGVARGVAEHSDFRARPFRRLARTTTLSLDLVFGDRRRVLNAAKRINAAHATVRGEGYSAFDPELLLWVFATLVDSGVHAYELFIAPLTAAERDAYYEEELRLARLVGLPADRAPADFDALRAYVREQIASGAVRVDALGRELARATLYPPRAAYVPRPLFQVGALIVAGLLPPALREQFALPWSLRRQAAFDVFVRGVRATVPRLPPQLRYLPQARDARRRVA
jgi:uncharacterized protein (DUF2236 family)